jgi:hypothetical protein
MPSHFSNTLLHGRCLTGILFTLEIDQKRRLRGRTQGTFYAARLEPALESSSARRPTRVAPLADTRNHHGRTSQCRY